MKIAKLLALCMIFIGLSLQSFFAYAIPQSGKEYVLLNPPQPTETGKKIEVLEIFWYGCPHCFDLDPLITSWEKKLPGDVTFRRMPAIFRDNWAIGAKTFYTMEALGELEKLHSALFTAIHTQGLDISNEAAIFDWMAKHGVDRKKFVDTYNSFSVQSKALRAKQMTKEYGITGVPSVIVDGKFMTSSAMAGGHPALLPVLDYLISQARKEHVGKK